MKTAITPLIAMLLALPAISGEPSPLAAVIQPVVDLGQVPGAVVMVVSKDRVLAYEAFGYSDLEAKIPMQKDAFFWLASSSKAFVGTAIMMLVDDGKLRLDDPVMKYLPTFTPRIAAKGPDGKNTGEMREPARPITLRMLLNHTSGVTHSFTTQGPTLDARPLVALVDESAKLPLTHEPGTKFAYTDAGINVAGRVVEVVSRMKYEDFLQRRLSGPLGMKETTFFPTDAQLARLAKSYVPNFEKLRFDLTPIVALKYPLSDRKIRFVEPAGGLFSTASDMAKFGQMLLNGGTWKGHRYLSEAAIREMTSDHLSEEAKQSLFQPGGLDAPHAYGVGWGLGSNGAFFHPGAGGTDLRIDGSRKIAVVWMLQMSGGHFPLRKEVNEAAEKAYLPLLK